MEVTRCQRHRGNQFHAGPLTRTPRPGIEPGSSAWRAEILTTILPRTWFGGEAGIFRRGLPWLRQPKVSAMEVTLCQRHRETNFTLAHSRAPWILTLSGDSAAGNWTRVFRVTGGNTNHYTTTEMVLGKRQVVYVENCLDSDSGRFLPWKWPGTNLTGAHSRALRGRELNPGLPRDRRGYLPLY